MDIGFHSLVCVPRNGIARLYGKLMFNFQETARLLSKVAVPFYEPTSYI